MKILIAYICMCTTLVISMFATAYADTKPAQITSIDDATLMQVKGIEQVINKVSDKIEMKYGISYIDTDRCCIVANKNWDDGNKPLGIYTMEELS